MPQILPGLSRRFFVIGIALVAILLCVRLIVSYRAGADVPTAPLVVDGAPEIVLFDPRAGVDPEDLPTGWYHRRFWFRPAMQIRFLPEEAPPSIRCETDGGGSLFGRYTDIDLGNYPRLAWSWRVDRIVNSQADERTREGDDHAARLFLEFRDKDEGLHHLEIIWSNGALRPGGFKYIGNFPHYVAHSGRTDLKTWVNEEVDLWRLYRLTSGRRDHARLTKVALFCDTDDTGLRSSARFGRIVLKR